MIFIDQMQEQSFKIEAIKPWEVERLEKVLVWGLGDHQWPLKDLFQAFGRERSCILGHMGNVTVEACNWLRGNIQRVTIWAGAGGSAEKAMAPHSSTLAWKIPWTEEPGRLQSMGSRRVRHGWETSLSLFTSMHWRRKWQPTPVFLPGESQGRRSLVGCRLWGRTESDTTDAT